jgi:hypothetical protein
VKGRGKGGSPRTPPKTTPGRAGRYLRQKEMDVHEIIKQYIVVAQRERTRKRGREKRAFVR